MSTGPEGNVVATTREHEHEIARLQGRLGERLALLAALDPSAPEYDLAADDVIAAARELIDFEVRVPALAGEEPRRISLLVLRGCGGATMAIAAGLALGVVPGGRHWWWLPIAVVLAVVGARLLTTRVRPDEADHRRQRLPAGLIAAGAVCAGFAQIGISVWFAGIAAVLILAGLLAGISRPGVQFRDLASGERLELDGEH